MDSKQDKKEEYEYKKAKQMKELADQENAKLLDIKKETEKTLRKILDTVEMMAQKGNYSTSYMCNKAESSVVGNVIQELQNLGFRTQLMELSGTKAISIKWDLEDSVEEENNN
jgi:tRNA G26 N,N-dimethylase Trm1